MIRIAFLTPSLHVGGAERWMLTLAGGFLNAVGVACVHTSPWFCHPAVVREARRLMHVIRPTHPSSLRSVRDAVDRACRHADVLISWGYEHLAEVVRNLDIPVVDVAHSDGVWTEQTRLVHRAAPGADFHVAVSKAALGALPEHVRPSAVVIYNGADTNRVAPRRGRVAQRSSWKIGSGRKIALFLGRFASVKRPHLVLDALHGLSDRWVGVFLGHGPMEQDLKRRAASELPGRCYFGSPVREVGDALSAADVLLLPSESEGMPLSLLEAWLARCPTVTTDFSFIREIHAGHGTVSFTVPHSPKTADLANAIQDAASGLHTATAFNTAWRHYTSAAMAQRWEEYLCRVLELWQRRQTWGADSLWLAQAD